MDKGSSTSTSSTAGPGGSDGRVFAETNPPKPQDGSWWSRNWKWVVALGCGCVLLLVLFVGSLLFVVTRAMKSSGAYEEGLARARRNSDVVAAMGEPLEPGFFVSGSVHISGPSGDADLAIPLSGPRGTGTLYVTAVRKAGRWAMEILEVEVDGRPGRIQLLDP